MKLVGALKDGDDLIRNVRMDGEMTVHLAGKIGKRRPILDGKIYAAD